MVATASTLPRRCTPANGCCVRHTARSTAVQLGCCSQQSPWRRMIGTQHQACSWLTGWQPQRWGRHGARHIARAGVPHVDTAVERSCPALPGRRLGRASAQHPHRPCTQPHSTQQAPGLRSAWELGAHRKEGWWVVHGRLDDRMGPGHLPCLRTGMPGAACGGQGAPRAGTTAARRVESSISNTHCAPLTTARVITSQTSTEACPACRR